MHSSLTRAERIRVTGLVQGVGFRPTIWRIARECGVTGEVRNDARGVIIHAWGSAAALDNLVRRLSGEAPPLARIENILRDTLEDAPAVPEVFSILQSGGGEVQTGVAADAATCDDCLAEILDPSNRRYRYPFTNCTHCGPRLSIVTAIPYDRANTSMDAFTLCPDCRTEYENPADRRFHAQPNACSACGPRLWVEDSNGQRLEPGADEDAIGLAARLLRQGSIVAIKGIGGLHLACDAGNEETVATLRRRKHRYQKALALMATDIDMVRRFAVADEEDACLLRDSAAPIVVLDAAGEALASGIAPGQNTLGFMLPYSPLHHLLMRELQQPMVLTSGNLSEEPQVTMNTDARDRLGDIADYYLLHDRDICNRLDDSVLRKSAGQHRFLRRARGYAPQSISLPENIGDVAVLAMGAELKSTFCLLRAGKAVISQHLGDLEDARTCEDYLKNLDLYLNLFQLKPEVIAVDRHPDYFSSEHGRRMAEALGVQLVEVQHHHAHIASCMAEHGIAIDDNRVMGVVLDGLGYGEDGTIWGGEFLLADYKGFERVACFRSIPLPGGTRAMLEPWRNTWAHLDSAFGWESIYDRHAELDIIRLLQAKPLAHLRTMVERGLNSPPASSCGRLFDAVAAALGICPEEIAYEGQAAVELESLAAPDFQAEAFNGYRHKVIEGVVKKLTWDDLWNSLLFDLANGLPRSRIAARFHQGLASAVAEVAAGECEYRGIGTVVLSGGVFQNRLLLEGVAARLRDRDLTVLSPLKVPANDGGLSLGQAAVAAAIVSRS